MNLIIFGLLLAQVIQGQLEPGCGEKTTRLLKHGCPTPTQFCLALFPEMSPIRTILYTDSFVHIIHKTTTTRTLKTFTTTHFLTSTKTMTHTFSTTVAPSTTTTKLCQLTTTCGGLHVSHRGCMSSACSEFLSTLAVKSTTRTVTHTHLTKTEDVAGHVATHHTTVLKTIYKTKTVSKDVLTVSSCITAKVPAQTCDNKGYQFAKFTINDQDYADYLSPWDLEYYKTIPPDLNGTSTDAIGQDYVYYEERGRDVCDRMYNSYRGYIFAPKTGIYTFYIPEVITIADIWVGPAAYSGYKSSNALLSVRSNTSSNALTNTISLVRGRYYPFRVAWACATKNGGYDFFMGIYGPDGIPFEGSYGYYDYDGEGYYPEYYESGHYYLPKVKQTRYWVQFGCGKDKKLAPPFPDWGHET